MFRSKPWALAMAVALSACGGGGDDPPPAGPTLEDGAISGSATKGIIRHGVVELYQDGDPDPIGAGSTDEQGRYVADYSDYVVGGGAVRILVRAKTEAEATETPPRTTMVCDISSAGGCGPSNGSAGDVNEDGVINVGEAIELPYHDEENAAASFVLNSVLSEPPAEGVVAPVTPFTELVYQRALERAADPALASSFEEAVLEAASEVSQLVGGLDVLRLEPVDLSNAEAVAAASPDQLAYAALSAAVLGVKVAEGGSGADALLGAMTDLRDQTAGGEVLASDLGALVAAAQDEFTALGVTDESGVLAVIQEVVEQAGPDGTVDPEPQAGAGDERVQRAKNLIANVRDTLNGLNEFEAPAQAFDAQVQMAQALLDESFSYTDPDTGEQYGSVELMFGDMAFGLDQIIGLIRDGETGGVVNGEYEVVTTNDGSGLEQVATIVVTGSDIKNVAVNGAIEGVTWDVSATFLNDPSNSTATQIVLGFDEGSAWTTNNEGTKLQLSVASGTLTLNKSSDEMNPGSTEAGGWNLDPVSSMSLDVEATMAQLEAAAEQEGGAVSFTGAIAATVVRCTKASCADREADDGEPLFLPSSVSLEGSFSNTLNSLALSLAVQVANAASFDPEYENSSGDTVTPDNFPATTVTLSFDAALGEVAPARVVLSGTLEGVFLQPETCEGCPEGLTYSDPDATATLTLLRDGVQVFRAQASTVDAGDVTDVETTLTDSTGASLVVYVADDAIDEARTTLRVDGVEVGELQETSSGLVIVRYTDGTFESLF